MWKGSGSVLRSQTVLSAGHTARLGLAFGLIVLLGRILEPSDLGFYTLVGTLFFLAHVALDSGTGALAAREIARDPERERPLVEGLLGWRRLVGSCMAVVLAGAAVFEHDPGRRLVLFGTAAAFLLLAPGGLQVVFQVRQVQGGPALLGIATQAMALAGAGALALAGAPGFAFAWLLVAREGANALVIGRLARRHLGYRPREGLRRRELGPFLRMALIQGLAVVLQTTYFHLDVLLVSLMRGDAELGAYAAAFRPVNALLQFPGVLCIPLLPLLAAAALHRRARFRVIVGQAATVFAGIGAIGAVAALFLAPDLITVLYGGRYLDGALDATQALRAEALAFAFIFANAPVATALLADRGERVLVRIAVTGLAVNLIGNLLVIPSFGFTGAAWTTALTEGVVLVATARALVGRDAAPTHAWRALPWILGPAAVPLLVILPWSGVAVRSLAGLAGAVLALVILFRTPPGRRLIRLLRHRSVPAPFETL